MNGIGKTARTLLRPAARLARGTCYAALDCLDRWRGLADELTPPRALQSFVGAGDFKTIGGEFFTHFRNLCDLQPDESVLDIGCGVGRMAIPLLGYLSAKGCYTGFDIAAPTIRWCSKHITRRNGAFAFYWADIFNKQYNPRGTQQSRQYRFPCEDQSVDFAFATSVFTHMFADDVRHYLSQIRRVLKPGGRGLLTYFILDDEASRCMRRPGARLVFDVPLSDCFAVDAQVPELAIAFAEPTLRAMVAEAGLTIKEPICKGLWSGREGGLSFQDIVIAQR